MSEPLYIAFIDESGCDGDKFWPAEAEDLYHNDQRCRWMKTV